jgi:methionyl-tRNA formyltransferase
VYAWHGSSLNRRISRQLFDSPTWPTPPVAEKVPARTVNSPEIARLFESLQPDVLLVCGAPILKQQIFSIPRITAVNVHFGIAPHYRGENALFWPLYRGDYDNIGFTLHVIDEGIDTGNVLARGYPALDKRDTEATLWAKCTRMVTQTVLELLQADDQAWSCGAPQQTGGRLFYRRERTIWCDAHYQWKRRVLRRRLPERPARSDIYVDKVTEQVRHDPDARVS